MPDLEAIGDAMTGAALARAVEPGAGEADGHTQERNCLNCGCDLRGAYCHCCGQRGHVHRTLGAFWHDLLHGVLHFEGKTWRTLPMLAWRPGELTRRYIEGERARFVSPIALFLFSVFLMFATVSFVGGPFKIANHDTRTPAEAQRQYERDRADSLQEMKELQAERARIVAAGEPTAGIDRRIANLKRGMELQKTIYESLGAAPEVDVGENEQPNARREAVANAAESGAEVVIPNWFDAAYRKAKENPKLLAYKLQNNGYKFSWALIPISVPFVWLLFLHRRRYRRFGAYDHTVFVTYSIAFMTLGFVALTLLRLVGLPGSAILWAIVLVPPVHMYRQLRGAYELSRWSALWRTVALLGIAFVAAALFMALLLALGVLA